MRYLDLYRTGELRERVRAAYARLYSCDLCPHRCGVNRLAGETGRCRSGLRPRVAAVHVHHGEEPPISGTRGSGTVFFSGCTLACRFCQNFPISQLGNGNDMTSLQLAQRLVRLQQQGVHNVNLVTPTHFLPQILAALLLAVPLGFSLPLVWNSSGYETVEALRLVHGVVDVFLPDMKYAAEEPSVRLSGAPGYPEVNRLAVREMLRQVGHLVVDDDGLAVRGLIIRHLVLPDRLAGTREIMGWIAANLGKETHIAVMNQYFPAHRAFETQDIHRKITDEEFAEAVVALEEAGLENGWVQE